MEIIHTVKPYKTVTWIISRTGISLKNYSLRPEGGGGGGKHHFFSFHICDRAAEDKQVEKKPDQNPTVHS